MSKIKDYFVENMAMLVDSGMDMLTALKAMKGEVHSSSLRQTIEKLEKEVDAGTPLWVAFQKFKVLPQSDITLIRIGEESGKLSQNLSLIATQHEKERSFRSKITSAMIYPVMVMVLALVIGIGISWFILPKLATVFENLKIDLPLITKMLIGLGVFLQANGKIAVPFFFLFVGALVYFLFFFKKTKFIGDSILFSTPGINKLIQQVELARFGYILGTLLDSGLPISLALGSIFEASTLAFYKKLYGFLRDKISEGNSFQKSFSQYKNIRKLIPNFIQQMIVAGEKSGKLSQTLLKIGKTYEEKTEDTSKNLSVILEPVLLVIVWLGVVAVAMAVILPIYSLIGNLNKS